jgi:hypothetical protein
MHPRPTAALYRRDRRMMGRYALRSTEPQPAAIESISERVRGQSGIWSDQHTQLDSGGRGSMIRLYRAWEATTKFGTHNLGGMIAITTKQ